MTLAERLEQELLLRTTFAAGLKASNKDLAESGAARLYEILGRPAPLIIWCKSPYQMLTLTSILIGLFFSDAWRAASGALAERRFDESWDRDFDDAWEALWAHGGQQLLRGMKQTSRIGSQYWELEADLFRQGKQELKRWLQSGKIDKFEAKLPKETIYRKFWSMQLWHLNFMQDHLRILTAELGNELSLELEQRKMQWQQFLPLELRLLQTYSAAESALASLINRLGAEPANQMKHCVWLPVSLPMISACRMWKMHVNSQAFPSFAEELNAWENLGKSCLALICLDHVVFACEKASAFGIDEGGRLHCSSGPALAFADGFREYAWHGVSVEPRIIMEPESITIGEIESAGNAELRRVLIERYGQARFLLESGAEKVHEDEFGILYKKEIAGDEPLVMVKVVNSSPEADGSFKDYFLRVPPQTNTARQGVAWTFGFEADDYQPLMES